ncbi:MAG TPA: hypothetical protein VKM72_33855 [Thermoanaerobaculia bacterium]|nr:hypothetical protein [Thermoanaerobaculia bacterium]
MPERRKALSASVPLPLEEESTYDIGMKVLVGTVVGGKVELPSDFVAEGAQVMVLAPESGQPAYLSATQERELMEAMEQIRRGEYVDGDALLNELRSGQPG